MAVYGQSYWAPSKTQVRSPGIRRNKPKGQLAADVVVVGGGFTGLASAYALAHAGLDVVVLEADRLAGGATEASIGAILPVPDPSLSAVTKSAGLRAARVAFTELRRSAQELPAVLEGLGIRCDQESTTLVVNAPFTNDAAQLKKEMAARKALKLDGSWWSADAAARALATETQGALRIQHAALLHPVRAALGLAKAARDSGARIFEQSAVRKTTFTRKDVTVVLNGATITARGVVVATGSPGSVFHQLERHVRVVRGYAVVSEPLTPAMRKSVGDRTSFYTEGTESPRFLRWLPGHRALFAGLTGPEPGTAANRATAVRQRTNQLMYELTLRYPEISGVPIACGWDLPIVSTADGLPWIGPHRNYPFHFFAVAFGWHGDGLAWHAAKAALRSITGASTREDEAFGFLR